MLHTRLILKFYMYFIQLNKVFLSNISKSVRYTVIFDSSDCVARHYNLLSEISHYTVVYIMHSNLLEYAIFPSLV